MVTRVNIAGRLVGAGSPCFIIAEAGVNHNGSVERARRLIDAAREAGVDAVKFQTWKTEKLVTPGAPKAAYQKVGAEEASQYQMLKALELSESDFRQLRDHAASRGVLFLSTPDEEESADFLGRLDMAAFKIGSAEITNLPFLRHVAGRGKPVILSTGMSSLLEVDAAVHAIRSAGNDQLVLLHCVSSYPAEAADCNLRAMGALRDRFGCPVGFSDHTMGFEVALAAVALGACVIEKHFTLDRGLPGPDHCASLEPRPLTELVRLIRSVESALGTGVKEPMASEADTRAVVRKKIVAVRELKAGETIGLSCIALLRAAGGMEPDRLDLVVGRKVNRDIAPGTAITPDMLV